MYGSVHHSPAVIGGRISLMSTATPAITVECYVRVSSLVAPVDSTVETLRTYAATGQIDELRVESWPDEISLTGEKADDAVLERFETFRTWADRHSVQLSPAFSIRERTTLVSDTASTVLVLPIVCLAIRVDGELASVVPHATATTTYTVSDALTDLREAEAVLVPPAFADRVTTDDATGGASDRREAEHPPTDTHDLSCPRCGEALVTGQGLYACLSCVWPGPAPDVAASTDPADPDPPGGASQPDTDPPEESPGEPDEPRTQPSS